MKKLYMILALLFLCGTMNAQVLVSGKVQRTNGDSVKGARVYIYSDTTVSTPVIPIQSDTTDQSGFFAFQLSSSIPSGTVFNVSTLNCDSVSMKINTHIFTGNNINSSLIICVKPPTDFSGYVYLGDSTKRPQKGNAMVYLIKRCGNSLSYIDSILTDTNGYFHADSFPTLSSSCELIMHARLLPSSGIYKKYLPAYYETNKTYALRWSDARDIPYSVARGGIAIVLPEAINPFGGPSKFTGIAVDGVGSRLPDKIMFLTDQVDVTVAYEYTTYIGDFAFIDLPFGSYKMFGDVWGKDNPPLSLKVDADHVYIDNIVFTENGFEYRGHLAVSVANVPRALQSLRVFPNPAGKVIYIQGAEQVKGAKQVQITDVTGAELYKNVFEADSKISIETGQLSSGMYMLQVKTSAGTATFKLIK